jgi:cyanophycin synthetase
MKVLDLNILRGPNYWSAGYHKLIAMKLDLEELEECPTSEIDGFAERIEHLIPSLYNHFCSEGHPGGFLLRVKEGTWMGHVIEHIAIEIQTLAGMYCGFGKTRSSDTTGVYHVIFEYQDEDAGVYTSEAALRIAEALVTGEPYDLQQDIDELRRIYRRNYLGPSTSIIVEEAKKRGIPFTRLSDESLIMLGYGVNQKRIRATVSSHTSCLAVDIACNKEETKAMLDAAAIPTPKGMIVRDEQEMEEAIEKIGFPLVLKPLFGNHGRGATINIKSREHILDALKLAQEVSNEVIAERYVCGYDYRLLVIDNKFVAAAKRTPASVTGDGRSTIQQLIDQVNQDPRRGEGHENVLTKITVDEITNCILQEKGLTLDAVLREEEILYLKRTANLSTGGTSTDVTDIVHPSIKLMAERIARIIGLDVCGIDVISQDITVPLKEANGAVLEVNACPGFRMHTHPTHGLPRNVGAPVVEMLFPKGSPTTIPIIAITGTNGKTTTTRLIAHMASIEGYNTGLSTTDGIYINNELMEEGDCTGPYSSQFILRDPTVDFAVLECARGGILRSGLAFRQCDVGVLTNIAADHLGLKDINTVEQMAQVKSVIPESVAPDGYAVMNAEDDRVYEIAQELKCNVAYFSLDPENPRILQHCKKGGIAAVVEDDYVTICKDTWKTRVMKVEDIPLTFSGMADFMTQNVLAAVLAGYVRDFSLDNIRYALETFVPSPEQTPGRMNMFQFNKFKIILDYAHNPAGLEAIGKFISKVKCAVKVGVISGVGDRRDEDLIEIGRLSAGMFDEIIVRQDRHLRGRKDMDMIELMLKGIREVDPAKPVKVIPNELAAIAFAIENARPDSFIIVCSEVVPEALDLINRFKLEDELKAKIEALNIEPLKATITVPSQH